MEWPLFVLDGWVWCRELSWNAEAVTGLVAGSSALVGGGATHWWQLRRSRVLPTLPSHAQALARPPDEATRFFSAVHELAMGVTEAWNAVRARESGGEVEEVIKRDVLRQHRDAIVESGAALRERLADYAHRAQELPLVAYDEVWSYDNRHNYRTETYTVTTTDSEGRTKTETRTRQVYVNTDHWFSFDANRFAAVERRLREWLRRFAASDLPLLNVHDRRVVIGKLDPAEKSFLERLVRHTVLEDAEAELTDADLEKWANQWLLGTRVDARLRDFATKGRRFEQEHAEIFATVAASESMYHYQTRSKTHSGPPGYRAHQRAGAWLRGAWNAWAAVDGMLETCTTSADELVRFAENPDVIESDRQYAELAVAAYEAAFPESEIEVDQLVSTGKTALFAGACAVLAAGLTYALHPAGLALW